MHVQVTDGVLQAALDPALWDGFGDGVHIELGDFWVIVGPVAHTWNLPNVLLLYLAETTKRTIQVVRKLIFFHQKINKKLKSGLVSTEKLAQVGFGSASAGFGPQMVPVSILGVVRWRGQIIVLLVQAAVAVLTAVQVLQNQLLDALPVEKNNQAA